MKKSFKERIIDLGLSFSKEMLTLALMNVLLIAIVALLYYFLKELLIILVGSLVLLAANYFYISRYSTLEKLNEKNHQDEFISLLTYFEIFISNKNNVYNSFRLLLPYCSPYMEDMIMSLLNQIDMDKSVGPFINFASKFSNRIIESLMLSIYQMVEDGENNKQFDEFNLLFSGISKDYHQSLIDSKAQSLESINSWPLFGAGGIIIALTFSIISLMGDMINVL